MDILPEDLYIDMLNNLNIKEVLELASTNKIINNLIKSIPKYQNFIFYKNFTKIQELIKKSKQQIYSAKFSPDGRYICCGGSNISNSIITIWDIFRGELVLEIKNPKNSPKNSAINSVSYSYDGRYICFGGLNMLINVWDLATNKLVNTVENSNNTTCALFSPDDKYLCYSSGKSIKIIDKYSFKLIHTLDGHTELINKIDISFSSYGRIISSCSRDGTIKLWNIDNGKLINTLVGHVGTVYCLSFSPDGRYICSGGSDKIIKIWDITTSRNIIELRGCETVITAIKFSPDGKFICSGGAENTIRVWDLKEKMKIKTIKTTQKTSIFSIFSIDYSPDGKYICTSSIDLIVWGNPYYSTIKKVIAPEIKLEISKSRPKSKGKHKF